MPSPSVSVVIPAYRQAEFLGDAIRSVLGQTYEHVDAIVVDDASPDETVDVVSGFDDRRVSYLRHPENRGLAAARNTGYRQAAGDIIAFLDADDYFHPEKIAAHVRLLGDHPDIGVSYNARFELNHSASTVRELWRPPRACQLADLVMGFPFAPSDMVIRRDWLERVGGFDESLVHFSEDLDINCRLALAGCRFAGVDRALNYRRYHTARPLKVRERRQAAVEVLERVLTDARCPADVRSLRDRAWAAHSLVWAFAAFEGEDTEAGQSLLRSAVILAPSYLAGEPTNLMASLASSSVADESRDHRQVLRRALDQFPPELRWVAQDVEWAVPFGFLLRATRELLWGRSEAAREHFDAAAALEPDVDTRFVESVTSQVLDIEAEFGGEVAREKLESVRRELDARPSIGVARRLSGSYHVNQAFHSYRSGRFADVLAHVARALVANPRFAVNRGVLAVSVRSIVAGLRPGRGRVA